MGESHYWRRGVVDIVLLDLGALPSSWASSSFAAAGAWRRGLIGEKRQWKIEEAAGGAVLHRD
jgi:hypothetical protein